MIQTPYSQLDPSLILDAIESAGFRCSGSLLALNSYENRVYQVGIDDDSPIIAKFYRPYRWSNEAILEEHQFSHELIQHEVPVVAPMMNEQGQTLHEFNAFRFALFPRQGGRALELDNLDQLEWMGRFIGRLHAIGATQPFSHRLTLNVEQYGYQPFQFLLENNFIPTEMLKDYCTRVETILETSQVMINDVNPKHIRLHGDCHIGNILWRDSGLQIVDLDDCLMGPAIQDLWMLLSGQGDERKSQWDAILNGYLEFHDFNYRERHLMEVLRTLRMIHYSGWLAKRWEDPAFPLNFPWFNTVRYWQEQLRQLNEQQQSLEEGASSMD